MDGQSLHSCDSIQDQCNETDRMLAEQIECMAELSLGRTITPFPRLHHIVLGIGIVLSVCQHSIM